MRRTRLIILLVVSLVVLGSSEIWQILDRGMAPWLILIVPLVYFIISLLFFILIDLSHRATIPYLFTRGLGMCFSLKLASGLVGVVFSRLFSHHTVSLINRLTSGTFLIIAMVAISLLIYQLWNKFRTKSDEDDDIILDQPIDN